MAHTLSLENIDEVIESQDCFFYDEATALGLHPTELVGYLETALAEVMAGLDRPEPVRFVESIQDALKAASEMLREILSGTPVLGGTRIPVTDLIDHLLDGETVRDFVAGHPSVSLGDIEAVLLLLRDELERGWLAQEVV